MDQFQFLQVQVEQQFLALQTQMEILVPLQVLLLILQLVVDLVDNQPPVVLVVLEVVVAAVLLQALEILRHLHHRKETTAEPARGAVVNGTGLVAAAVVRVALEEVHQAQLQLLQINQLQEQLPVELAEVVSQIALLELQSVTQLAAVEALLHLAPMAVPAENAELLLQAVPVVKVLTTHLQTICRCKV
jgi:hypothetical protein